MRMSLSSGTETEITTRKHTKTLSVGATTTRNFVSLTEATQNGFQLVYASCCSTHSVHVAGNRGEGGTLTRRSATIGIFRLTSRQGCGRED